MSEQSFARATALNPAVTIGVDVFSFAVEFKPWQANRENSHVVSGDTDATSTLSGSRKKVVAARAFQRASYTLTEPGPPVSVIEVEFEFLAGGNIAATTETERIYWWNNDAANRGSDARTRALPGDTLWITEGGVRKGFTITEATPFAEAPSEVNYVGDTPRPTTTVILHAPNRLAIPAESGCAVTFTPDSGDAYDDCGVRWGNGVTGGVVTRRIFQTGDPLADDEYFYPFDAEFDPVTPEYWFDPRTNTFRFGTVPLGLAGATEFYAIHYQRRTDIAGTVTPETSAQPVVVEAVGATGYAGTSDSLAAATVDALDDFTVVLDVSEGAGSIEFRSSALPSARVVALEWDADGDVTGKRQRSTDGGSIGALSGTGGSYSFPMQVRIIKAGTSITFAHRQNSAASWVSESALTINFDAGRLGIATASAVKFSGVSVAVALAVTGATSGAIAVQRVTSANGQLLSKTYTLPTDGDVVSIHNDTTDREMEEATGLPNRNGYAIGATTVTFWSEASGDRIRIEQAASGTAPTGPGRPPSAPLTENFATMSGVDGVATTATSENRCNWRDVIVIHDPLDEFPSGAGTDFSISRDGIFDSNSPPDLYWDVKSRVGHDWTLISASDYVALWAEGIVYFKSSFIAAVALTGAETLCIRAVGQHLLQRGGVSAESLNDCIRAADSLDEAWIPCGLAGALADEVSGITSVDTDSVALGGYAPYPTAFVCDGSGHWDASALAYGTRKSAFHAIHDLLSGASATPPAYFYARVPSLDVLERYDTQARTLYTTAAETFPSCGGNLLGTHAVNAAGDFDFSVFPTVNIGGTFAPFEPATAFRNYFGGMVLPSGFGNYPYSPRVHAEFGFQGTAFTPPDWFKRLPDGATIIEAKMLVRFGGFRLGSWNQVYDVTADGGGNFAVRNFQHYREGVLVHSWDGTTAYHNPSPPTTPSSGLVTFALVGRRKKSSRVYLYDGTLYGVAVPDDKIDAIGSSVAASSGESGKWKSIDVTGAMQRLYTLRNSLYSSYEFWPTVGLAEPDVSDTGLAGYLRSLMPVVSATLVTGTNGRWGYTSTQSGRYGAFDTLELGSIACRIRLASGQLADRVLPINEPPMIAAWS